MKDTLHETVTSQDEPATSQAKKDSPLKSADKPVVESKPSEETNGGEKEKLLEKKKGPSDKIIVKENIQTGKVNYFAFI
jgi:hypothetical protein